MRLVAALVAAMLMSGGTSAEAGLVKLVYVGNDLSLDNTPPVNGEPPFFGDTFPAFMGEVLLDESAFGGSVANKTLNFSAIDPGIFDPPPMNMTDGIVSWSHTAPLYSTAGTEVSFTFDADKNLVSWIIDALDGPPDYYSSPSFDFVLVGDSSYSGEAGTWTTEVIPLPATGTLLGAAALALAALRRRAAAASGHR